MVSLKILIIEDDLIIASDIKSYMQNAGHHVIGIARDSKEAMKLVKTNPPDLAIIDITLGKLSNAGILIAREIQTQHWMPFIYLTSHSDSATLEKAGKTLPSAYLLKPFRAEELLIQVGLAYSNFANQRKQNSTEAITTDSFYLPFNNGHERVTSGEILYLEAQGACVNVYIKNRKSPGMIGMNLGNLSQYFNTPNFFRLSRSLFINMDHIKRIERTHIYLGEEKVSVEISEANRKELLKRLNVIRTK